VTPEEAAEVDQITVRDLDPGDADRLGSRDLASPAGPQRRQRTAGMVAAGCALVLAGGALGAALTLHVTQASGGAAHDFAGVAASLLPSVVMIDADTASETSQGSGVILGSDGIIVTNNHVIADTAEGAGSISVTFSNGSRADATIIGRDAAADIAVIRATDVSGLTPATLGSAAGLHVGDMVLAAGSPLGLPGSVTAGVVSALHRTVVVGGVSGVGGVGGGAGSGPGQSRAATGSISNAIQTDASVNPGSSGGPLADGAGRVVGITTATAGAGGGYVGQQAGSIGVAFAIPIDTVERITNRLMRR